MEDYKAAMHLQKQFPKRREYYFWAIMSCLLLHVGSFHSGGLWPGKKRDGMVKEVGTLTQAELSPRNQQ